MTVSACRKAETTIHDIIPEIIELRKVIGTLYNFKFLTCNGDVHSKRMNDFITSANLTHTQIIKYTKNFLCYTFSSGMGQELPCGREECLPIFTSSERRMISNHLKFGKSAKAAKRACFLFDVLQSKGLLKWTSDEFVDESYAKHKTSLTKTVKKLGTTPCSILRSIGTEFGKDLVIDLSTTSLPSRSAYVGAPRKLGGCRKVWQDKYLCDDVHKRECDAHHYKVSDGVFYCLKDVKPDTLIQPVAIKEPLKVRIITKGHPDLWVLKPLQDALTRHLGTFQMFELVKGIPVQECVDKMEIEPSRSWLSGDYTAATDNLHPECPIILLENIFRSCRFVGASENFISEIKRTALREVGSHTIQYPKDKSNLYTQTCGQLMGSLLSFPLLCLTNFATYRCMSRSRLYRKMKDVNDLLINGDDLFCRANETEFSEWKKGSSEYGLDLSIGKNFFSKEFGTVNSQLILNGTVLSTGKFGALVARDCPIGNRYEKWMFNGVNPSDKLHSNKHKLFIHYNKDCLKQTCQSLQISMAHGGLGYKTRKPLEDWTTMDKLCLIYKKKPDCDTDMAIKVIENVYKVKRVRGPKNFILSQYGVSRPLMKRSLEAEYQFSEEFEECKNDLNKSIGLFEEVEVETEFSVITHQK